MTPVTEMMTTEEVSLLNGSGNSVNPAMRTLNRNDEEAQGIDNYDDLI